MRKADVPKAEVPGGCVSLPLFLPRMVCKKGPGGDQRPAAHLSRAVLRVPQPGTWRLDGERSFLLSFDGQRGYREKGVVPN